MTKAEQFCKLNGIEWHEDLGNHTCYCGKKFKYAYKLWRHVWDSASNPTVTDAKSILEVMMKREDWPESAEKLGCIPYDLKFNPKTIELISCRWTIPTDYVFNSDKLLDEAINFCEKNET